MTRLEQMLSKLPWAITQPFDISITPSKGGKAFLIRVHKFLYVGHGSVVYVATSRRLALRAMRDLIQYRDAALVLVGAPHVR